MGKKNDNDGGGEVDAGEDSEDSEDEPVCAPLLGSARQTTGHKKCSTAKCSKCGGVSKRKKGGRPGKRDNLYLPIDEDALLRHNFMSDTSNKVIILQGSPSVLKVACALASTIVAKHWNEHVRQPFDVAFECGKVARTLLGLNPEPRAESRTGPTKIKTHVYLPDYQRRELDELLKAGDKVVVLTTILLHIEHHLSRDFRDAYLLIANSLAYNKCESKGGQESIRAVKRILNGAVDGLHQGAEIARTPHTPLGSSTSIMMVPAKKAEQAIMMLWNAFTMVYNDVANEEQHKLASGQLPKEEGSWKKKYFCKDYYPPTAESQQPVKRRRLRLPIRSDPNMKFYTDLQKYCKKYSQGKLEYQVLPKVDLNSAVQKLSTDGSYDNHQDCKSDLLSEDPDHPKILKGGVQLPYRAQLSVGTTCLGFKGAAIDTHLTHGTLQNNKMQPKSRITTYVNSGHFQPPTANDGEIFHNAKQVPNLELPKKIKEDAAWTDVIDSDVPKNLIPEGDITPAMMEYMMRQRLTASIRETSCPWDDKAIYVEGAKAAGIDPASIDQKPGFLFYGDYDQTNVMLGRRPIDKKTNPKECGPVIDWHRDPEFKDMWNQTTATDTGTMEIILPWRESLHGLLFRAGQVSTLPKPIYKPPRLETASVEVWKKAYKGGATYTVKTENGNTLQLKSTGIKRPHRHIHLPFSRGDMAMNYVVTNIFAKERKRLVILQEDGTVSGPCPLFVDPSTGVPFPIGSVVHRDKLPMNINRQRTQTICCQTRKVIACSAVYKNIARTIDNRILHCADLYMWISDGLNSDPDFDPKSEDHKWKYQDFKKQYNETTIEICGTAGSAQKKGSAGGIKDTTAHPKEAHFVVGAGQNPLSEENSALMECWCEGNAIAVFVLLKKWLKARRKEDVDISRALQLLGLKSGSAKQAGQEKNDDDAADRDDNDADSGDEEKEEEDIVDVSADPYECEAADPDLGDSTTGLAKFGSKLLCLGYFYVESFKGQRLSVNQIQELYSSYPGYLSAEPYNCSHYRLGTLRFKLRPALEFSLVIDNLMDCLRSKEQDRFEVLVVKNQPMPLASSKIEEVQKHIHERRTITVEEQLAIDDVFGGKTDCPRVASNDDSDHCMIHPAMISKEEILGYHCCAKKLEEFLGAKPENEIVTMPESDVHLYKLAVKDVVPVCVADMGVASERILKEISTKTEERNGKNPLVMSLPLVGVDMVSEKDFSIYPDPLRTRPLACSNPDADVATCFLVGHGKTFHNEIKEGLHPFISGDKIDLVEKPGYEGIYEIPDWKNEDNCRFVAEVLGGAFFNRCTGNVPSLEGIAAYRQQFREHLKKSRRGQQKDVSSGQSKTSLPVSGCVFDTIACLLAESRTNNRHMRQHQTNQHLAMVDKHFRTGKSGVENMCLFLERFFLDERGVATVSAYLNQAGSVGGIKRSELMHVMAGAISQSSKLQEDSSSLRFIIHHAIADVESLIPEFAGEVTMDSIQTGYGAQFTLKVLTRFLPKGTRYVARLCGVHLELCAVLVQLAKDCANVLLAMGYRYDNLSQHIVSIFTGRIFSLTDTEHICCKVYICIALAHPSRTITDWPTTHAAHCWPIPGDDNKREWMMRVLDCFGVIRAACATDEGLACLEKYNHQLKFHDQDDSKKNQESNNEEEDTTKQKDGEPTKRKRV